MWVNGALKDQLEIFISIKPLIISTPEIILNVFTGSPRKNTPNKNAPTAPIPVQIAYAVPNERLLIEIDKSIKLNIMAM
jgi:hypothetical protein